jgi:alkylhydroperoxidase/carboxymuconolactone decarboxylase family protein YurZ
MNNDTPVMDTLEAMTSASIKNSNLSNRELLLTRIAALAASGAPAVSYLAHVGPSLEVGVTLEDVQGVLTTVAPIIGSPRTVLASANVGRALGFVIMALEAELDDDGDDAD